MQDVQEKCPCGSGMVYAACCGRYHSGLAVPTAEGLMRSRYTAYVLADVPYLIKTTHSTLAAQTLPAEVERFAKGVEWRRLEVIDALAGGPEDAVGQVEFRAWYKSGGQLECIWERSRFEREGGRWRYHSGQHRGQPKIGRNDPCPCGSGAKFKKCCA